MSVTLDDTLRDARSWLRAEARGKGAPCPCCTQFTKVYRRQISCSPARVLILMWKTNGRDWVHLPTVMGTIQAGGEPARMRYWGLIEEESELRPDGGRCGWWRVTHKGEDWILRSTSIQKYALVYNGRCLGMDGPAVTIVDALGKKFDLRELMK